MTQDSLHFRAKSLKAESVFCHLQHALNSVLTSWRWAGPLPRLFAHSRFSNARFRGALANVCWAYDFLEIKTYAFRLVKYQAQGYLHNGGSLSKNVFCLLWVISANPIVLQVQLEPHLSWQVGPLNLLQQSSLWFCQTLHCPVHFIHTRHKEKAHCISIFCKSWVSWDSD